MKEAGEREGGERRRREKAAATVASLPPRRQAALHATFEARQGELPSVRGEAQTHFVVGTYRLLDDALGRCLKCQKRPQTLPEGH